ncbi:hypothetical protein RGQ13_13685 [Thalassotalea psychrophila]|uniref:YjbH domain-containing protein n=1 Tax=Thalassotalea psychrophila TaxID=3065647 RepID=A0ABY9TQQ6_9GAMM|nr:hypothetical protein RGQ13_13685 [Colwelliaceae bacterium SQ149]
MKKQFLTSCILLAFANSAQTQFLLNETESKPSSINNSYSMQAFTGVFNTPTAEVINWGDFGFSYSDNYFDQGNTELYDKGFQNYHDLKFGVGILPGLEVVARLATETWACNGITEGGCGTRDLSGSIKWQIPFIPKDWFSLAIGGQDVGGSVVKSEAYYVSASKEFTFSSIGAVRTSLGVATSDNAIGYMDGAIGSVEYQPFEVLQVAAEYDANAVNVGVKAFAPDSWLPNGWDLYVSAHLYSSDDEHNERDAWFNFGISVPLGAGSATEDRSLAFSSDEAYRVEMLGEVEGLSTKGEGENEYMGSRLRGNDGGKHGNDGINERVAMLAQRLENEGFESVSLGLSGDDVLIRIENNIYNQNEMDAIAVVRHLSLVALGDVQGTIELTNSGVVSYAEALRGGDPETSSGSSETGIFAGWFGDDSVNWLVKNESSTHFTPRLILAPELKSLVGTEYGAYDYEVAISSRLQMSLWDGGVIEVRHLSDSVVNSDDFDGGEYYQKKYGLDEGIDTRLFHQTFVLPFNVFTKFSFGRVYGDHDGLLNETRWADNTNTHRVTTLVGDFENDIWVWGGKKTIKQQPKLVKYRYRYHPLNWDIELTAGEYWHGDKGFTLRSLHWFNNVQVGVRYKRTKFDDADGGEEEDFLALGFSIPLNFGKSMKPNYGVQVMGTEQWDYYIETSLTEENTGNTIKSGFGKEPSLYHNLNRAYFNRDRY